VTSFHGLHLDGVPLTESMAERLAKLMARNTTIESLAVRQCLLSAVSWQRFSAVMADEIGRSETRQRVLEHLTMSHNAMRRHSVAAEKRKRKKGDVEDDSVLRSMDCGVLCAKKLFFARCHLDRGLLEQIVDGVIDYRFLQKLDFSFNELGGDGLVTLKLSAMSRRVRCLEALQIRDCGLTLSFIQDLLVDDAYDWRRKLNSLDLAGNVMTHYAADALGRILQSTLCPVFKLDLSNSEGLDGDMLQSVLMGPFRAPFKGHRVEVALRGVNLVSDSLFPSLSGIVSFAEGQSADCQGIQRLDVSDNGLGPKLDVLSRQHLAKLFCLEALELDFNFVAAKKKGAHRPKIEALCAALCRLPLLRRLSVRGEFDRKKTSRFNGQPTKWLTTDDLMPLLELLANAVEDEYGDKQCQLEELCLDGNRLKDEGCKVIAASLASNGRLQRLWMERNKCSFKGFLRMIECIVAAEEAQSGSIKLCDVPMASILEDPHFRSKVKKHREPIRRCIAIIQRNADEKAAATASAETVRRMQSAAATAMASAPETDSEPEGDGDHKEEGRDRAQSPSLKYTAAHDLGAMSNVDRLAAIMSSSKMPQIRRAAPIEDVVIDSQSARPNAAAKVTKTGMDAIVDRATSSGKGLNAKSRRKKRTRRKIDV